MGESYKEQLDSRCPFLSWSLAALAAIFLHGKPCFHRSKNLQPRPVWGRGAAPDCKLKAQLDQDQFCRSLCINYSCLYPHPISLRLWGPTKTSFHEDCHFQPSQRNHTELRSAMIKSGESGASKFIPHFESQHELHKKHHFSASQYPHPALELITTPPLSRPAVRINWYL